MRDQVTLAGTNLPKKLVRHKEEMATTGREFIRTKKGKGILYDRALTMYSFSMEFDLLTSSELNTITSAVQSALQGPVTMIFIDSAIYSVIATGYSVRYIGYSLSGPLYRATISLTGCVGGPG